MAALPLPLPTQRVPRSRLCLTAPDPERCPGRGNALHSLVLYLPLLALSMQLLPGNCLETRVNEGSDAATGSDCE